LILPGDRFIVRQFSPVITIGGGFVLDASPLTRKVSQPDIARFLTTLTTGTPEDILHARVGRRGLIGMRLRDVPGEIKTQTVGRGGRAGKMNIRTADAARMLAKSRALVQCDEVLVTSHSFSGATAMVLNTLDRFHDVNPLVQGISKEELRDRTGIGPD